MTQRVADIVAGTLAAHGIRHAFGIPGGEVVTLIDALELAGIRFRLTRHETAAAIMAAGASTTTAAPQSQTPASVPGLMVSTLGPGLANGINGIADAAQEHVPLIVMSGVVDHNIRARYTHQVVDQAKLLAPLVKASFEVEPEGVGATVARAIAVATAHPQGPVHIDLAPSTAAKSASADDKVVPPTKILTPQIAADDPAIADLLTTLQQAKRPIVVAGLDALKDQAGSALEAFATNFQAPVITTYKAKGLLDETHPLSLGGAGLSPLADKTLLPLLQSADVVILAGYDPIEMRQPWCNPFKPDQHVIAVGPAMPDHGMHHATHHIVGHTRHILEALNKTSQTDAPRWTDNAPTAAHNALQTAFTPPDDWGPHAAFSALQETLPEDAVVTVDSGAHRILLSQMMRFKRPNQLLQSAGFCTMGAAVPLAAGAKAANPNLTTLAVLGDGGLEMGLGELATLRDQELPVVIYVLQDESLALIELKQRQAGLTQAGVKLGGTRFEDIAAAFGGYGVRVTSKEAAKDALTDAYTHDTFTIIVVEIKAESYVGHI